MLSYTSRSSGRFPLLRHSRCAGSLGSARPPFVAYLPLALGSTPCYMGNSVGVTRRPQWNTPDSSTPDSIRCGLSASRESDKIESSDIWEEI